MRKSFFSPFELEIKCSCGGTIDVSTFYDELRHELTPSWTSEIDNEETFICPSCSKKI